MLIDENNVLIAGHGRTMAAKSMGLDSVPAVRLTGLDETKKKALRIADNQLALNAGWDLDLLAQEVQELELEDYGLDILGFDDKFLDELLTLDDSEDDHPGDEEETPEPPSTSFRGW